MNFVDELAYRRAVVSLTLIHGQATCDETLQLDIEHEPIDAPGGEG